MSAKAVALLVVLAFAVGTGSATAIYSVINGLFLKPVPYQHGERFVSLLGGTLANPKEMSSLSVDDLLEYQRRAQSFDVFGWFRFANYNLTAPGQPLHINAVEVTPSLANNVGVNPRMGQWFRDAAAPVAVISDALWRRLGSDPGMAGKSVTLSGRIYTVTGIMPPRFHLPLAGPYGVADIDVWLPLDPLGRGQNRAAGANFCYARLRPGVTRGEAEAEVKRIAADIARRDPAARQTYTARVDDVREIVTGEIRPVLLLLFAAAELLLLITAANVCGLLLARSVARARETAVRVALGAGLRQLGLQYFLEGIFVSLAGAAGGLLFSAALVRMLASFEQQFPLAGEVRIDGGVLAFALGTALLAGALTSLAPLWQAVRTLPNDVLNEGVRASAGARSRRVAQALVVAEVALAFVLLAGSAVLVFELRHLMRVWPGFDPDHLLTFQVTYAREGMAAKTSRASYQARLVEALEAIPGVSGAGFTNQLPLNGCCYSTAIYPEGARARPSTGERVSFLPVSPSYLRAMRIPLRRGRFLNEHDTSAKLVPVVINEAAVARYWPKQDAVGAFGHFNRPDGDRFQVVGVVGNVKNDGLDNATVPEIYMSAAIAPVNPMSFAVRSSLPAATLVPEVRRAIQNVNPAQPIHEVRMMSDIARDSMTLKRAASYIITFFASAALLMAVLGTYGVASYSVRQRIVEMGTRMALGAVSRDLLYLVLGSGLKIAAYAVAIGGIASVAAAWVLVRQVGVQKAGLVPFLISAGIVAGIAVASSFFPAWRATRLSPLVAIRNHPGSMWESARHGMGRFFERVVLSMAHEPPSVPDTSLMTEFIDASRRAGSFREALRAGLESLRRIIGARSAVLLENASTEESRSTVAVPDDSLPAFSIPRQGLLLNRLRFYTAPLSFTSGDFDVWRRWAAEYKPDSLAEIETLRNTGARLAVPLRTNKELLGVLLFGAPAGREAYSQADKRVLRGSANHFALMLENARLTDRLIEQEKLQRDIALAAEVQKRLLPRQSLETPAVSLSAASLPARSVGGDYYDFLELDAHRTGIALADVAGKGVAAALIMSVVQASLRVIASERDITPPQLAARMNHFLYRSTGSNSYATFFYAQFDECTRGLRYVNAGHNPPYLVRPDSGAMQIQELATGGMIIGMFPNAVYEEGWIDLRPDDVLLVFTDGVTEALNPGGEEFGEERLKDVLRQIVRLPVEEMSARILCEVRSWIQDAPQHDDLTCVLMKVKA